LIPESNKNYAICNHKFKSLTLLVLNNLDKNVTKMNDVFKELLNNAF